MVWHNYLILMGLVHINRQFFSVVFACMALGCGGNVSTSETHARVYSEERAVVLRGAQLIDGSRVDVKIRGNMIVAVGTLNEPGIDVSALWLVPAFIDSHVHMTLRPAADKLAESGVAAVVDMASPRADGEPMRGRLFLKDSGPMITSRRGYPTQGWGRGGYGRECDSKVRAIRVVDELLEQGADIIKIPLGSNGLPAAWARDVVRRAHEREIKVVAHTLSRRGAMSAADVGADVLAHLPLEPMDAATLDSWGYRTVVTTMAAFGGSPGAIHNLRQLRERGALILYGTDLGNTRYPGIHPDEIRLMMVAGMDGEAILAAATSIPAAFWGFDELGAVEPGKAASFMLLAEDPKQDPLAFTRPSHVYIDGVRLR